MNKRTGVAIYAVVTMSAALDRMRDEEHNLDPDALTVLSPYQTEHINRLGNYNRWSGICGVRP